MKRLRERLRHLKLRYKLVFIFLVTSMIALGVNLFVYLNLNRMLSRIDMVYSTNISLNDLSDALSQLNAGTRELANGVAQLSSGASSLADGAGEFSGK